MVTASNNFSLFPSQKVKSYSTEFLCFPDLWIAQSMYPTMHIECQSYFHEKPDMLEVTASTQSFVSLMSFI